MSHSTVRAKSGSRSTTGPGAETRPTVTGRVVAIDGRPTSIKISLESRHPGPKTTKSEVSIGRKSNRDRMNEQSAQERLLQRNREFLETEFDEIDRSATTWARQFATGINDPAVDGDDLKQSAWLRYLTQRMDRAQIVNFRAWFFVILRRLAIDRAKAASRLRVAYLDHPEQESETGDGRCSELPCGTESQQAMLEYEELRTRIERYVAELPTPDREIFQLRAQGRTPREIASILGIARLTVYAANQKFKKDLRKICEF